MSIGDLKRILATLPDDLEVTMDDGRGYVEPAAVHVEEAFGHPFSISLLQEDHPVLAAGTAIYR